MSDQTVLIIAAIAALFVVVSFFKILGSVIKAVVIAAIAAGALYFLLPRLEETEGAIGEAAQKVRAVTDDLEGSVSTLKDKANEATATIKEGVDSAKEAAAAATKAQDAAEKTQKAAEKVKEAVAPAAGD